MTTASGRCPGGKARTTRAPECHFGSAQPSILFFDLVLFALPWERQRPLFLELRLPARQHIAIHAEAVRYGAH